MTGEQAIEVIRMLSYSQGFYGRLLSQIENFTSEEMEEWNRVIENQGFTDNVDLVIWLES